MDDDCEILETPPPTIRQSSLNTIKEVSEPLAKKSKTLTSDVWNYFEKVGMKDGKEKAKCKSCGQLLGCKSSNGTKHLLRHRDSCSEIKKKYHDVGDLLANADGRLTKRKFDPKVNREILSELIITHSVPFNMVEWRVFRKYQKFLNDECRFISRNTAKADVMRTYVSEKQKLKLQLTEIPGRVCLTSDCWTACTNHGFISLTSHFVDSNWKLNSKILAFTHMKPPHTGHELALKLLEFLKDWGIERKVFSLTLDNATSNDSLQMRLKEHLGLSNSLLLNGEFFHIRCCAHILNLIVQDGLALAKVALQKIRQSVHYVKVSESRTRLFIQCIEEVGGIDTSVWLRPDVVTRWNSTYLMLESAITYRRAFHCFSSYDTNYKWCPTNDEWRRGEIICTFLQPFSNITKLISGSSYPTSNLYFGEIWSIECLLKSNLTNEDLLIQCMAQKMKEKFDKYWSEYSMVLAFGTILDPTKKLNFVSYTYAQTYPYDYKDKVDKVKENLYRLYAEYVKIDGYSNANPTHSQSQVQDSFSLGGGKGKSAMVPSYLNDFEEYESSTTTTRGKTELDTYLEQERVKQASGFDVLAFWKDRSRACPTLSRMACDVLSIPITTVASESAFSIGSRVLNKYRSSLNDETVQALLCTRSWLYGFEDYNNEDEDDVRDVINFKDPKFSQGSLEEEDDEWGFLDH